MWPPIEVGDGLIEFDVYGIDRFKGIILEDQQDILPGKPSRQIQLFINAGVKVRPAAFTELI
jgi:hypothetical protein